MIRILIVDDSATIRTLLKAIFESDPEMLVVGMASNGVEAAAQTALLKPDVITMDILMPVMNGFEATRRIMAENPTPIVVVTSHVDSVELNTTFNAIKAGALDVIAKPVGQAYHEFEPMRSRLIDTVKLMAGVKVVRRRSVLPSPGTAPVQHNGQPIAPGAHPGVAVIVIGASTGGPAALNTLFKMLPSSLPAPVVVVQHMTIGFTEGLVSWLRQESHLPIVLATHNQRVRPGEIYFAPDDQHLEFAARDVMGLNRGPLVSHVRPSVTRLFDSAARVYGSEAIGVLLTGMGDDGAIGLAHLHEQGAPTIAQNEASAVVFGMPKVAVELGAADFVLPLERISPTLLSLLDKRGARLRR